MRKAPRLKPLEIGDIMVALIKQQQSEDHLGQYKALLGQIRNDPNQEHHQIYDGLRLPEFATTDMTPAEILDYHIRNKITDTTQNEKALEKLDQRIKNAMEQYSGKLKQGQNAIQDLMEKLGSTCNIVSMQRNYLTNCINRVKKNYSKIVPTIHKINNIKKVIAITSIWGQAKLPYLLSIDIAHPYRYDIEDVFNLFDQAIFKISQNTLSSNSSSALKSILKSLQEKKNALIASVCQNFTQSIIRFTDVSQYKTKYQQYMLIVEKKFCKNVMTAQGISQILKINARNMFYEILTRITPNANLDMLNETAYLDFFDEIIEEYVIYFRSWHLVTTFHIDSNTPYGRLFLQHRRQVFITLSEQLSNCFNNSNKFIAIQYRIKLNLVEKLEDYMQAGQKWMGRCEQITLPKVVTVKLKKQLQNVFNLYNNLIKNVLTQQISVMALQNADQDFKPPQIQTVYQTSNINYNKISKFLHSTQNSQNTRIPVLQTYQLPAHPTIKLKIGSMFIQMILQYLQRAKYLQTDKSIYINKIIQHFQFILFILYQVAIRDQIKSQIDEDISQRTYELGRSEEINLKNINEVAKLANKKRKYYDVIQFMNSIGSKYDGVKVAGIIDVNKVFNSGNSDIVNGYTKLVVRVINDLLLILEWLIEAIPCSVLKGHRRYNEIHKIKNILLLIFDLILENNMEVIGHKYVDNMSAIMGKLKWEIKKFNMETSYMYKQYKMKALEIFRNNTLLFIVRSQAPQLANIVQDKEVETLYRSMLECYGKIEKINDNGRQLIRMDSLQVTKILQEIGVNCSSWATWFEKYLDYTSERNYRNVLDKVNKVGLLYPPVCWKYHIMWIIADISFREKKEYYSQLCNIYLQYLREGS